MPPRPPTDPARPWHPVRFEDAGLAALWGLVRGDAPAMNSTHHQAVDDPGALRVGARAPDGVVEAAWAPGHRCAAGVQGHPELIGWLRPFEALVARAR